MATRSFTTSDQIKDVLAVTLNTEADDWKRDSKTRTADGNWVRAFTNTTTKETVTVTESREGGFSLKTGNGEVMDISLEIGDLTHQPGTPAPALETDPAKNAAADKVVAYMIGDEDEPEHTVQDKLVEDAGRALANRYCFAVSKDEGGTVYAMMTPVKYFERAGACSEATGPLSHLMPKCAEMSEATWEIGGVKTPAEGAKYLQSCGFFWNPVFQEMIDGDCIAPVAKALAAATKAAAVAAKKDQPQP